MHHYRASSSSESWIGRLIPVRHRNGKANGCWYSLTRFSVPSQLAAAEVDTSLLWGPYRPNLYLGLRPRIPNSLLLGLMWARVCSGDYQNDLPSKFCLAPVRVAG